MKQLFLIALVGQQLLIASSLEHIPPGEAEQIAGLTKKITSAVKAVHSQTGGIATRDAHAKAHGCVKAEFKVNENLPPGLTSSVFVSGKTYPAWIRFSNGSGKSQNDSDGDGRGLAIKLMGVQGDKLSQTERYTQDFLMINHPTFFVRNVSDYLEFQDAVISGGSPIKFFFPGVNPLNWRIHEMKIARAIQGKDVQDMLATRFWSMTPILYQGRAAKVSAIPCANTISVKANTSTPNFLRDTLAKHLTRQEGCYDFAIQFQRSGMPVEDPTEEWNEREAQFHKVARILIPQQGFQSKKQMEFCENLSLNPWHAVEEHRPLGGINRARRAVYEAVSTLRHELNHEPIQEPNGSEQFE